MDFEWLRPDTSMTRNTDWGSFPMGYAWNFFKLTVIDQSGFSIETTFERYSSKSVKIYFNGKKWEKIWNNHETIDCALF